jgi:beta-lactam-binding protein with PASTA domain
VGEVTDHLADQRRSFGDDGDIDHPDGIDSDLDAPDLDDTAAGPAVDPPDEVDDDRLDDGGPDDGRVPADLPAVTPIGPPEELDLDEHPRATIIGIIALAALFLFASFAVGNAFRDGEQQAGVPRVPVPKLQGDTIEEAQRTLSTLKLLVAVEYQPNEVVPSGVVFDQRPVAGSKLEIGTEVTLVVSDGPAGLTVPDVRGFQGAEAAALLQALGFSASVQPVYDETVRPGEVVATTPAAGNRAVLGAPVAVQVSNGPAPRTVPVITNQQQGPGLAQLGRSGVGLGKVTTSYAAGTAPGIILSTNPPGGSAVARDYPVDVVVSGSPATLTVPPVAGLLQASATSILTQASLTPSVRPTSVPAGDPRAGRVVSQSLPAGTAVATGTPVQLVVGVAAAPPTTTTTVPGATTVPPTTAPARPTTTAKR